MAFKKGDKVKIREDNDNENYSRYKNKILTVTNVSGRGSNGYDDALYPEKLYSFKDEDGNNFPFSLYDYEIKKAK